MTNTVPLRPPAPPSPPPIRTPRTHFNMKVGVNLGAPGYMAEVASATADINVQVIFCNAGYILSGFFYTR
jgi:hypothetical protein